ncbi:MAG: DevR family CRISPR-associated autoregulator [Acidobacteriota bacterium]
MTRHLFGAVLTSNGTAANNRGENEGNITTLQKLLWQGELHTTVSAEAIRWAMRYYWQQRAKDEKDDLATNRCWDDNANAHTWRDENWQGWNSPDGRRFIDDDVLGYMRAEAAKEEGSETESEAKEAKGKGKKKPGTINNRRGVLELTRAVSTTPFVGDLTFNSKSGSRSSTSLYATEVHATRYQYGFALTPSRLHIASRAIHVLDAICNLGEVAGNHSRFLYDFSPESIVLRWTHDFAPRLLYCFDTPSAETVDALKLLQRVEAGDIDAKELIIGGYLANTETGTKLKQFGAETHSGVKVAVDAMIERLRGELL